MVVKANTMTPIISKAYCCSSQTSFMVRRRPHVVNGGGFVVTNYDSHNKIVFKVDGCGTLGTKGELILRDAEGDPLLLILQKGGIVQALSIYKQWQGYKITYDGAKKPVFRLKEPVSCLVKNNPIRITTEPRTSNKDCDFQILGSFPDKACSIVDANGNIVAQVGVKTIEKVLLNKDVYNVVVQPGFDQAFVFGVIAILDNINGESTAC